MAAGMTTSTIKPETLQTTACCKAAGFLLTVAANTAKANVPRDENGKPFDPNSGDDVGKHFFVHTNPLSLTLVHEGATTKLKFGNPGRTENILFLQYHDKNITSTVIPTKDPSVCYFTTENLSGCNFFVDHLPDGNLVCLHANAIQFSPTKAEVQANAAAFNPKAVTEMDKQHSTALKHPDYHGATHLYQLRVAEYFAAAKVKVDEKVNLGYKDVNFFGGTTVVGFRVDGRWQFWFQTYGQFTYTIPGGMFKKDQVITIQNAPLERLEARCFWRQ